MTWIVGAAGYAAGVPSNQIRTLDLFAGAGGLSRGFEEASDRFTPVTAVEFDIAAAASYQANHPDTKVVAGPIEDWVAEGDIPEADLVVGGPPCQGFSALGKRDVDDARNSLWTQYAEVIVKSRPKYFVVENVDRFLKSPQFGDFVEATSPGGILEDYEIPEESRGVLNAADFGAPQARRRTVLIGRHRDMPAIPLPTPTVAREDWRTVRQAFKGLPRGVDQIALPEKWTEFENRRLRGAFRTHHLHLSRDHDEISLRRFEAIPEGGNRFHLPDELLAPCWRKHKTGSGDVMGRLFWDRPSVTIRTEFVKPEKGRYLHPTENRTITLQEGARLQGFPDDYRWCGSKTAIAKQIGNAVPIKLGEAIGRAVLAGF